MCASVQSKKKKTVLDDSLYYDVAEINFVTDMQSVWVAAKSISKMTCSSTAVGSPGLCPLHTSLASLCHSSYIGKL
jgi:hypothetical protein